jgi:hypothetical protein
LETFQTPACLSHVTQQLYKQQQVHSKEIKNNG